jgi:Abnormal spindle-like microcephaly-assoc'd, ASPM-SPD-2-Hydin
MKTLKRYVFVIASILVFLSTHAWAAPACAPFGQTEKGTISSPGQSNACTFSANAGDVVDFTVVVTSGNMSPKIQIYDPTGMLIASKNPYECSGSVVELDTLTLASTGTYTEVISDCSGSNTGNYVAYSQSTNNPFGAVPLSFGQTVAGTIASAALNNTYTFAANANDVMDFTITAKGISPKIRLYSPSGALVASNSPYECSGSVVELDTVTLPATASYTVLIGDCSDTLTGTYEVYSQRTNNPTGAANLPFDRVQSGNIGSAAQNNSYTFKAKANDTVDFTVVATGLSPKIRLYSPSGALVASNNPYECSSSVVELDTVTLTVAGTYTVLVADCSDKLTGTYDVYAERTESPVGAANLPFGQTLAGTISSPSQNNVYTFSVLKNDVLDFTMVTTSGGLSPKIRLYSPSGALVASNNPYECSGSVVEVDTVTLTASGTYTVLVGDCSDTLTGKYEIYSQRTNNPSGAPMLLLSQTQTGSIADAAQNNSYVFAGSANDLLDFTLVTTGLSPKVRLYSPTGALVAANNPYECSGSVVEMNVAKLPASGTYTVLVADCSDTHAGSYTIYAQRTNSPFEPAPIVWGGQTRAGQIVSAAQSLTYTFAGTANDSVDLTMVTTKGSLSPKLRLYNPDGTLLASANPYECSGSTVQLNSVSLAQTGIYTLLAGDCSDILTGNFNLSGQCFGTCPAMPAINWAEPASISYGTPLSATQLDATSAVSGSFAYTPAIGKVLAEGPQNLSVLFKPTETTTYANAEDSVQITVNPPPRVSPTSLSFGNQAINETSAAKTVTLTNAVTGPLTITNISATAPFAVSSTTCESTLAAGKTCTASVTFTPKAQGEVKGTLSFADNAPNSPQKVSLSGTGVEPATLSPASANYGTQKVGTTSAPKLFTLVNNQNETLSDIVISTNGDFAKSATTCSTTLAAYKSCSISVTFTPKATGTRTGQLSVSDSAGNSHQTASLTGMGN